MEKVVVLGSGPAGLTAALYCARANLEPLVITGMEIGGQISITNIVENYPGFPQGLTGPELVELMKEHAERFGARYLVEEVVEVDLGQRPFRLRTQEEELQAQALIVATGASPRRLGVPGEEELIGRGVSFCATCDGFFFRGKDVVVVGGGDSALEEGLFLTRFASRVQVIHRRDQLRAGPYLQDRARKNQKISFLWDTVVTRIEGDGAVRAVQTRHVKTGEQAELPTEGVFIYIGHTPNSELFRGQLEVDEHGYLKADWRTHTSVEGVFAAGEIGDPVYRQIVTSAGQGCKAAMEVEKYLARLEHEDPS